MRLGWLCPLSMPFARPHLRRQVFGQVALLQTHGRENFRVAEAACSTGRQADDGGNGPIVAVPGVTLESGDCFRFLLRVETSLHSCTKFVAAPTSPSFRLLRKSGTSWLRAKASRAWHSRKLKLLVFQQLGGTRSELWRCAFPSTSRMIGELNSIRCTVESRRLPLRQDRELAMRWPAGRAAESAKGRERVGWWSAQGGARNVGRSGLRG